VPAAGDNVLTADDDIGDVGSGGSKDDRGQGAGWSTAGEAHGVERDRDEVGRGSGLEAAALGPAERPVPTDRRHRGERGGRVVAASPSDQSLVELDGACLLEEIDHGV
jgi:hypothetical protein